MTAALILSRKTFVADKQDLGTLIPECFDLIPIVQVLALIAM